jgi:L-asparaginase II
MTDFLVRSYRGGILDSEHRVSAAVCLPDGTMVAVAGDPGRAVITRSAAKPFQALPVVADGAAERFAVSDEELALACASHNSERHQVDVAARWLERIGCAEDDLACGPHRALIGDFSIPLGDTRPADEVDVAPPSRLASNCSGKHTGMLALARHRDWKAAGYHLGGHPVQDRAREMLAHYAGLAPGALGESVDGCGVVAFALPLSNMARAFAGIVADTGDAPRRIVRAMSGHPEMVAGHRRLCTEVMQAYPGRVLAKVGAGGVYGAALIDRQLGIAIKVEDGGDAAAMPALMATLEQLGLERPSGSSLDRFAELPVLNTRWETVGVMRSEGELSFV